MRAPLRRAMLVDLAVTKWLVPRSSITIKDGIVAHVSGNPHATFGELVAMRRKRACWNARGAAPGFRAEAAARTGFTSERAFPASIRSRKTTGAARYAMDVRRPGMLTAVIARPPKFGSALISFDAAAAKAVPGVVDVVAIPHGSPKPPSVRSG